MLTLIEQNHQGHSLKFTKDRIGRAVDAVSFCPRAMLSFHTSHNFSLFIVCSGWLLASESCAILYQYLHQTGWHFSCCQSYRGSYRKSLILCSTEYPSNRETFLSTKRRWFQLKSYLIINFSNCSPLSSSSSCTSSLSVCTRSSLVSFGNDFQSSSYPT